MLVGSSIGEVSYVDRTSLFVDFDGKAGSDGSADAAHPWAKAAKLGCRDSENADGVVRKYDGPITKPETKRGW